MKKSYLVILAITLILVSGTSALAADDLVQTVVEGCKKKLEIYCKDVTPGQGRVLVCLYARSDKLSGQCEYALYDAAAQLERFVATLSYVANECGEDLNKLCSGVPAGQGLLLNCIEKTTVRSAGAASRRSRIRG